MDINFRDLWIILIKSRYSFLNLRQRTIYKRFVVNLYFPIHILTENTIH